MFHLFHLNHGLLYNLFHVYFADRYKVDDCLAYIFRNLADATRIVYEQFELSCCSVSASYTDAEML